jgi:hypothetical protein
MITYTFINITQSTAFVFTMGSFTFVISQRLSPIDIVGYCIRSNDIGLGYHFCLPSHVTALRAVRVVLGLSLQRLGSLGCMYRLALVCLLVLLFVLVGSCFNYNFEPNPL